MVFQGEIFAGMSTSGVGGFIYTHKKGTTGSMYEYKQKNICT